MAMALVPTQPSDSGTVSILALLFQSSGEGDFLPKQVMARAVGSDSTLDQDANKPCAGRTGRVNGFKLIPRIRGVSGRKLSHRVENQLRVQSGEPSQIGKVPRSRNCYVRLGGFPMAQIRPFKALRYSSKHVPVDRVVTQPYDKISPDMQARYRSRHPNNLVRILRSATEPDPDPSVSPYQRASETLQAWRREGIIEQVKEPSLFAYFQRYRASKRDAFRSRKGLICLAHLEDYDNRIVFPHERTLTGPKQDRLELLRHTRTHFGQVFLLYSDPSRVVDAVLDDVAVEPPEITVRDEYDVWHMLWRISDTEKIPSIQAAMADKQLVIADGHHRYETALAFRDEKRKEAGSDDAGAFEWLMTTVVNMESPGMTILPTHRVISNLPSYDPVRFIDRAREYFNVHEVGDVGQLSAGLEEWGARGPTIGVATEGGESLTLFELRDGLDLEAVLPDVSATQSQLDVVILHSLILGKCLDISDEDVRGERYLRYVREFESAVAEVQEHRAQICFLMNATRMEQVRDIALGGEVLPQKSTDFFPKLLSGLTMYSMD